MFFVTFRNIWSHFACFPLFTIYFHNSLTFHIHFACILLPQFCENVRFVTFYIMLCVFLHILHTLFDICVIFQYSIHIFMIIQHFTSILHSSCYHTLAKSCVLLHFTRFRIFCQNFLIFKHYASNATKYM